jgi:signal transduction histidine kinase/ActR/RegA family two-component response regulator
LDAGEPSSDQQAAVTTDGPLLAHGGAYYGGLFRLGIGLFVLALAVFVKPEAFLLHGVLAANAAIGGLSVFLTRSSRMSRAQAIPAAIFDGLLLGGLALIFGCNSMVTAYFILFVVGYTVGGGTRLGAIALAVVSVSYGTVVLGEYFGVWPHAPYAVERPPVHSSFWPWSELSVVIVANTGTYVFVALAMQRINQAVERERLARRAERKAQAKSATLQLRLAESSHVEALARFAGGISHEFNNLTTILLGYARLVQQMLAPSSNAFRDQEEVIAAGERAAELAGQLLAFGRQELHRPQALDLSALVRDIVGELKDNMSSNIAVMYQSKGKGHVVNADPNQLRRVLGHLAANAGDAMPEGGTLHFKTSLQTVPAEQRAELGLPEAVRYVVLAVRDTGKGMNEATRKKVFEPFFTTKPPGHGTGLGLAAVQGMVNQNKGAVRAKSEVGQGSVFYLYFPQSDEIPADDANKPSPAPEATETILVAEDEPLVRRLVERILKSEGYRVLVASNGPDALQTARHHLGNIELLLTDVIMPGMSGYELAESIQVERPQIRVLFMSAYTGNGLELPMSLEGESHLLPKPFSSEELQQAVRQQLNGQAPPSEHAHPSVD